jgi:large subunit ribosomal protein L25
MNMFMLEVSPKNQSVSNVALRKSGLIPAVYFHKNEPSVSLMVKLSDFLKLSHSHNPVITLSNGKMAVLKEVQIDPVSSKVLHLSLQGVVSGEKFHKDIPLVFVNAEDSKWQKEGMVLHHPLTILTIETTPENLPEHIEVDVSVLTKDTFLRVKDLKLPAGIKVLGDQDVEVAGVSFPSVKETTIEATATPETVSVTEAKK